MSNELARITVDELKQMAIPMAKCNLFGFKTPEEALSLMLIAQAEGLHPAMAARDYHVIQGKPALKADAMLARFQKAGGSVKWLRYDDEAVVGEFSHLQGGTVSIEWTMAMANAAGLTKNPTWQKYKRAMLRSRCISEGIRTVFPGVISGFYTEEEVSSFSDTDRFNKAKKVDAKEEKGQTIDVEAQATPSPAQAALDEMVDDVQMEQMKAIRMKFAEEAKVLKEKYLAADADEACIGEVFLEQVETIMLEWYALCNRYMLANDWFSVPQNIAEKMHELLKLKKPLSIKNGCIDFGYGDVLCLDKVLAKQALLDSEKEELTIGDGWDGDEGD